MRVTGSCRILAVAAGATTVALVATAAPAGAAPDASAQLQVVKTVASGFVGPLQFTVDGKRIFVADSFVSALFKVHTAAPIATGGDPAEGGDVSGVATDPVTHALAYTTTNAESHTDTTLTIVQKNGKKVVASLSTFESTRNSDQVTEYGIAKPISRCVRKALAAAQVPARYFGQIDSHPYAAAALGDNAFAVADAGGNDIVKVDRAGNVSLIAVLPAQPLTITAEFAAALGLPACAIGVTYRFEPVPTDVEVGPDGSLYVSTLPGGPEDPSSGARGSVYKIDSSGVTTLVATGFSSSTNLAVTPDGTIYVAELGTGTVSKVEGGAPVPVASLPGVVAVEYANGQLYASIAPALAGSPQNPGSVVILG